MGLLHLKRMHKNIKDQKKGQNKTSNDEVHDDLEPENPVKLLTRMFKLFCQNQKNIFIFYSWTFPSESK